MTKIICGDCLDVLPTLAGLHYQVAVADPPYIIGGKSIAEPRSKAGTWADMMNSAHWYLAWIEAVSARLTPDGWLLVFGNWRSLPTYLAAAARATCLSPQSCMVWDKRWMGPAGTAALRPRWELVLWLGMPECRIEDRSAEDLISCKWSGNMARSGHPAEKPVALISALLGIAAPHGGTVLDPFCGRGSAGLAALEVGMDYTGIEVDPVHAAAAEKALSAFGVQGRIDL